MRRLNILRLSSEALNKDEKEVSEKALETIKNKILDLLEVEVEGIINEHYIEQRDDAIDKEKLVNDFADLGVDSDILKAFSKVTDLKLSNKELNTLEEQIQKMPIDKIKSVLKETIKVVFENKIKEFGDALPEIYKIVNLQIMDQLWTDHLDAMGDLREGIGLRGYAQRDPLVEYKNEAFGVFEKFVSSINSQFARRILKIRTVAKPKLETKQETNTDEIDDISTGNREINAVKALKELKISSEKQLQTNAPTTSNTKVNKHTIKRNDPCPCGSGLKYKKCGLINSPKHRSS